MSEPEKKPSRRKTPRPVLHPDDSIGYLLRDTYRYFQRLLQARIETCGITMGHWFFLRVLWEQEGLTQAELSKRAGIMTPRTVTALNDLEKRGLVERKPHPSDKRKYNVFLTREGRALERQLLPYAIEVNRMAAASLQPAEVASLRQSLKAIREELRQQIEKERR